MRQKKSHDVSVRTRVPDELKQRWQDAAALHGQTLTDFLIVAANKEANEIFEREERIELSRKEQKKLARLLLSPPELTKAMGKLLSDYADSPLES